MPDQTESKQPLDKDDPVEIEEWWLDLTYKEVHLFTEGVYRGLLQMDPRPGKELQGTVLADSWYYKGGFVIGYILKALLVGLPGIGAGLALPGLTP